MHALLRTSRYWRIIRKVAVVVLATVGGVTVLGAVLLASLANALFRTEVVRTVSSSDKAAVAEVEVRKGGLGTVWTTRVHLRKGSAAWTIYETKDSDFVPPLRWSDPHTLVIGLPCDRFGYVSNPDDWQRSDPAERRLKVRVEYTESCPPTN